MSSSAVADAGIAPKTIGRPAPPRVFAPLLPVALAATAGIVLDRYVVPHLVLLLFGVAFAIAAFLASWLQRRQRVTIWCLVLGCALLAAAWHRVCHQPWANDLRNLPVEDVPLARLRGIVLDHNLRSRDDDPLRSLPPDHRTVLLLEARELIGVKDSVTVSGRCRVTVVGRANVDVGDEVEVVGELQRMLPPGNPGEADVAAWFHDRGIGATLRAGGVTILNPASFAQPDVLLARVRWWAGEQLDLALLPDQAALARALLLGEQSALGSGRFEDYQRTGVYHILAISGQHLAILSLLLWPALRVLPAPRWQRALLLGVVVVLYALLTGGRPPILRAAVMVCVFCGGMMLRRPIQPLNALALAWLLVAALNPADLFEPGCQISFLCVLVLLEVIAPLERAWRNREPLDRLVEQARPYWQQMLLAVGRWFLLTFVAGALLWLIVTPLTAARYHLVSPAAILLGPPMVLLSSLALVSGFLLLACSPLGSLFTWPFALLMKFGLDGCEQLVDLGEGLPLAYWYTAGPPDWWLGVFYGGLLAWILVPALRIHWRGAVLAAIAWLCLLLMLPGHRAEPGTLRCTLLAVGHGSCAVLELPDGRVVLYDAGSIAGPEVTVRQVAPFLWERGIARLDEVFLSHADLDHFNGVPALMARFPVSQVSVTPSFLAKNERGVHRLADELAKRGTTVRILSAGQFLKAGDVHIEVLHPPENGPEGTENARSLVLLVRYMTRSLLLTGDLEEPGLSMVLAAKTPAVDVLLAPHHGSAASNTDRFAAWATPRLVITSEGRERGRRVDPYTAQGAELWRTSQEGAVTIRFNSAGIQAETFRTHRAWRGR